ncbi:hypothetical protein Scep_003947 [Stephania cephalantha]|uniref:Uncharacterized protein n=1 Tax=Stephania cephalantha TaxID=152367 RepID=A0AAP0PUY8_9MAGN
MNRSTGEIDRSSERNPRSMTRLSRGEYCDEAEARPPSEVEAAAASGDTEVARRRRERRGRGGEVTVRERIAVREMRGSRGYGDERRVR